MTDLTTIMILYVGSFNKLKFKKIHNTTVRITSFYVRNLVVYAKQGKQLTNITKAS